MSSAKFSLKYEVYVAAPVRNVWETLTDGSATKQYFYGCSVRSTFKKGAPISYLGDGEFNMLDGKYRHPVEGFSSKAYAQAASTTVSSFASES